MKNVKFYIIITFFLLILVEICSFFIVSIKKNDFFQPSNKKNLVTDKFERKKLILAGIKKSIEEILEKHTMIIVYPIPEAGALVAQKLFNKFTR